MKSVFLARAIDAGTKRPVAGPHLAAAAGDLGKRFGRKSKTAAAAAPASGSDDGTHSATPYARSPAPPEGHKAKPWLNTATNAPEAGLRGCIDLPSTLETAIPNDNSGI